MEKKKERTKSNFVIRCGLVHFFLSFSLTHSFSLCFHIFLHASLISHSISREKCWPSIENGSIYGVICSWFDELYCFHVRLHFTKCSMFRTTTQMCNSHRNQIIPPPKFLQLNFVFFMYRKVKTTEFHTLEFHMKQ